MQLLTSLSLILTFVLPTWAFAAAGDLLQWHELEAMNSSELAAALGPYCPGTQSKIGDPIPKIFFSPPFFRTSYTTIAIHFIWR
jgi:hypothetical protein